MNGQPVRDPRHTRAFGGIRILGYPEIVKVMFWSYLLVIGGLLLLFLVADLRHT